MTGAPGAIFREPTSSANISSFTGPSAAGSVGLRDAMPKERRRQQAPPHQRKHLRHVTGDFGKILDQPQRALVIVFARDLVEAFEQRLIFLFHDREIGQRSPGQLGARLSDQLGRVVT